MLGDDEQAGEARDPPPAREGKRGDARQVDAHQRRGAPVERDRLEALPPTVRSKKSQAPTNTAAVTAMMKKLW